MFWSGAMYVTNTNTWILAVIRITMQIQEFLKNFFPSRDQSNYKNFTYNSINNDYNGWGDELPWRENCALTTALLVHWLIDWLIDLRSDMIESFCTCVRGISGYCGRISIEFLSGRLLGQGIHARVAVEKDSGFRIHTNSVDHSTVSQGRRSFGVGGSWL